MPAPGDLVGGRFVLGEPLGKGGMASVWRALDRKTGDTVALKLQHDASGVDGERLLREGEALGRLDHPAIVRVVGCGRGPDREPWLAMEWLSGEDLASRLRRDRLSVRDALVVARVTASGLAAAHEGGVIHRDVKPANLFLVDGRVDRLKLVDFGIARWVEPQGEALTGLHFVIGTPGYLSPEQARGRRDLDPRTDLFALGAVLWEALAGRPAFVADSFVAILAKIIFDEPPPLVRHRPDVPAPLSDLVGRLLAKSPADRPSDARAVLDALEAICVPEQGEEPARAQSVALGPTERRVVSVVLARPGPTPTVSVERPTIPSSGTDTSFPELSRIVDRVEILSDGSIVAAVTTAQAPTDQVTRAARAALVLARAGIGLQVAVGMAEAVLSGGWRLEGAIDRASALLRGTHRDPGDQVRIDDATAGLLDARFEVRRDALGAVLVGESWTATTEPRRVLGKATPFVGREGELRSLRAWVAESFAGRARAIVVTGPPGIGKTRLHHELVQGLAIAEGAPRVWAARADVQSAGAAFAQLGSLIRSAVAAAAAPLPSDLAGLLEGGGSASPVPDPRAHGDRLLQAWLDFVAAALAEAPLAVVLDDVQWGDAPSLRFVEAALRSFREARFVVLAFGRPELRERFAPAASPFDLDLDELPPDACAQIARATLGVGADEGTVRALSRRAGGNPLCLEELLRSRARGLDDETPQTVIAMMQARLAALEAPARATLRAASVFGQSFWESALAALLPSVVATKLRAILGDLVDGEVIEWRRRPRFPDEVEYAFRHVLLREAAYASLTPDDRRLGHRLAAAWLERAGEPDPAVLARHFELGDGKPRAAHHHARAAEQALEGSDLEAALDEVGRAVACGAEGEALGRVRLLEATALRWRGALPDAWRAASGAAMLLPRGKGPWFAALDEHAAAALELGDADSLEALAVSLVATPAASGADAARVIAGCRIATCLVRLGREAPASRLFAAVATDRADLLEREPLARGHAEVFRATCANAWGDYGGYLEFVERAREAFREAGNLRDECLQAGHAAAAAVSLGSPERAEQILRDVVPKADRLGLSTVALHARLYLAYVLGQLGRHQEGIAVGEQALAEARRQGHRRFEAAALSHLGLVELFRGDPAAALRWTQEAAALPDVPRSLQPLVLGALADAQLRLGWTHRAVETGRRSLAIVEGADVVEDGDVLTRLVLAEALDATGAREEARALIARGRDEVMARAALIRDERWRTSYLERVDDNARTLARARQWLGGDPS